MPLRRCMLCNLLYQSDPTVYQVKPVEQHTEWDSVNCTKCNEKVWYMVGPDMSRCVCCWSCRMIIAVEQPQAAAPKKKPRGLLGWMTGSSKKKKKEEDKTTGTDFDPAEAKRAKKEGLCSACTFTEAKIEDGDLRVQEKTDAEPAEAGDHEERCPTPTSVSAMREALEATEFSQRIFFEDMEEQERVRHLTPQHTSVEASRVASESPAAPREQANTAIVSNTPDECHLSPARAMHLDPNSPAADDADEKDTDEKDVDDGCDEEGERTPSPTAAGSPTAVAGAAMEADSKDGDDDDDDDDDDAQMGRAEVAPGAPAAASDMPQEREGETAVVEEEEEEKDDAETADEAPAAAAAAAPEDPEPEPVDDAAPDVETEDDAQPTPAVTLAEEAAEVTTEAHADTAAAAIALDGDEEDASDANDDSPATVEDVVEPRAAPATDDAALEATEEEEEETAADSAEDGAEEVPAPVQEAVVDAAADADDAAASAPAAAEDADADADVASPDTAASAALPVPEAVEVPGIPLTTHAAAGADADAGAADTTPATASPTDADDSQGGYASGVVDGEEVEAETDDGDGKDMDEVGAEDEDVDEVKV